MKTSIIIRTKNEEKFIGETLDAVFLQNYNDFEVIVVDSGSTDNTLKIVSMYDVDLIEIPPDKFTFGYSLNVGAENAKGKYLVYLSAHAKPINDKWLHNLTKGLKDKDIAAVYGRQIPRKYCNPLESKDILQCYGDKSKIQVNEYFFSNVNSAIKKEIWKSNRFDEKIAIAEDHEWAKRILRQGFKIKYEPSAVVIHSHNYNFSQVYKRYYNEGLAYSYIYNLKMSLFRLIGSYIKVIVGDYTFLQKQKKLKYIPFSFLYRLSQNLGLYMGLKK